MPGAKPKPLVLTHVTVIDTTGAPANPDMTVVTIGDRIADSIEQMPGEFPFAKSTVALSGSA